MNSLEPLDNLVRLYLSPFAPALLSTYLTNDIKGLASDINYNTLETFPDRPYGYVTLPAMEAAKVKNKFKGAILKGSKVRVEEARPVKRNVEASEIEANDTSERARKRVRREKRRVEKSKSADEVMAGVELDAGRSVKRGWTEPKEVKNRKDRKEERKFKEVQKGKEPEKSKYTKEPELLFKTKVPPNRADSRSSGVTAKHKKKQRRESSRNTVVHEFEKTQRQASFLKNAAAQSLPSTEFVDGKGWVDQNGSIIESARPAADATRLTKQKSKSNHNLSKKKARPTETLTSSPSISSTFSSDSDSDSDSDSSSISSDSSSSDSDADIVSQVSPDAPEESTMETDPAEPTRHPLETLFKRSLQAPDKRPSPIATAFNFFGELEEVNSAEDQEFTTMSLEDGPQTPFAQHVTARNVSRSGAPTPDTAAVHRRFSFTRGAVDADIDAEVSSVLGIQYEENNNDMLSPVDETSDGEINIDQASNTKPDGQEESVFATWFWKNRGDNNRLWKARRKEAMKEKRQRETRRLGRRIV